MRPSLLSPPVRMPLPVVPLPEALAVRLRCPVCGGALARQKAALACAGCGARWPFEGAAVNLLPPSFRESPDPVWRGKQDEMESAGGDTSPILHVRTRLSCQAYARLLRPWLRPGACVLDIGIAGAMIRLWLPRTVSYVGLDPSPHDLVWTLSPHFLRMGFARRGVPFLRGVGEHIPFEGGTFDVAVCTSAIDHAQDPERLLREMARVLKPGGVALVGAPMEDLYEHRGRLSQIWKACVVARDPLWVLYRAMEACRPGAPPAQAQEELPHPHPLDSGALKRMMTSVGFRPLKTGAVGSVFYVLAEPPKTTTSS